MKYARPLILLVLFIWLVFPNPPASIVFTAAPAADVFPLPSHSPADVSPLPSQRVRVRVRVPEPTFEAQRQDGEAGSFPEGRRGLLGNSGASGDSIAQHRVDAVGAGFKPAPTMPNQIDPINLPGEPPSIIQDSSFGEPSLQGAGPLDGSALRKIDPRVLKELLGAKDGQVNVIVQFAGKADLSTARQTKDTAARRTETVRSLQATADRSQRFALQNLEQGREKGKVESYQSLWIINGAAVRGDRDSIFSLAARPEVESIRADQRRYLPLPSEASQEDLATIVEDRVSPAGVEWNIAKIRADAAWSALGIDGTGAVVASLDTGVDWQHPALINSYRGKPGLGPVNHNGNWYDFTSESYLYPADFHGHGTHVTGIMVGSDGTNQVGVAPGAKWIAAKVFTSAGNADDSWIHAAFQWILAPDGDPNLAPDIVNASWGSPDDPRDEVFRPDIEALLAAGIIPVFAAGNDGNGGSSGSVDSPASLDVAFAVGATDSSDVIAYFSSRGPSPWGKIKPDASAPGVSIRSTYRGGSYGTLSGTSMATPHVAGLLALLRQANSGLTPLQALSVITSTALSLGTGQPNNDYGWGRIDAYAAVSMTMQAGILSGVVRGSGGSPVAGALVTATNQASGSSTTVGTGQDGAYSLSLAPGFYDASAGAFGYVESTVDRVAVEPRSTAVVDFSLIPLSTGLLVGSVVKADTGSPLAATVAVVGTPLSAQTEPGTGAFTLTLPAGTYDVRATSERHRVGRQSGVAVAVSTTTTLTFTLAPAPSILLVDSGAWYSGSKKDYYTSALDQLSYLYAVRPITNTSLKPTAVEMAPYDIVIWSSPQDSPGYIGADTALAQYLDGGGRLLLSGQDIGYYDGGGVTLIDAPYFRVHLQARFVSDDAGNAELEGLGGGIFEGITLTLNTADSARNQLYPDVIEPRGLRTATVMNYLPDGGAGIETDVCLPYRLIYLGFGLEGAGPASNRTALLQRAIDWLVTDPPTREARVMPATQSQIEEPGRVATSTITVWNTGTLSDTFALLAGSAWPTSIWDGSFSQTITSAGEIASCQAITIGVRVEVPLGASKNISSTTEITLQSTSDPAIHPTATVMVKTPAVILLVDDDRFYDVESRYKNALFDLGYPFDVWDTQDGAGPDLTTLNMYSITIWFTGYDWYQPLTAAEETILAAYLDRGGRLFFSSQDYLYVRKLNQFGIDYLGILSHTDDITATLVSGVPGDIVGDGLGPFTLTMPYEGFKEWSDELAPGPLASASFVNFRGVPAGLTNLDGGGRGRAVFFSFPFEGLEAGAAGSVMGRIVERALSVDVRPSRRVLAREETDLRYDISVINAGNVPASWAITSPVPGGAVFLSGSLEGSGAVFDAGQNRILWQGDLAPGEAKLISYRVSASARAPGPISNVTYFEGPGGGVFARRVTTSINYVYYFPVIRHGYTSGW